MSSPAGQGLSLLWPLCQSGIQVSVFPPRKKVNLGHSVFASRWKRMSLPLFPDSKAVNPAGKGVCTGF